MVKKYIVFVIMLVLALIALASSISAYFIPKANEEVKDKIQAASATQAKEIILTAVEIYAD